MSVILGSGGFKYEAIPHWENRPEGANMVETASVAVDSKDNVYAGTQNPDHPVMVFDRTGKFLHSFGKGVFGGPTPGASSFRHGMFIGPDDAVWCADTGAHCVMKFDPKGNLLMTLGTPGQPSKLWGGEPFNRPTHAAISPNTGNIFISDGYGNFRVHKYSSEGQRLLSWGEPGVDPGQFMTPHNVAIDSQDRVYVADRENHRIQVFDANGKFITMWNNIHRPAGLNIGPDGNMYVAELNGLPGFDNAPDLGHRVSILTLEGELLARLGHSEEGEEPGKFTSPHGIAVDSHGDIYVGETCFSQRGRLMKPPKELKSFKKLRKVS